MLEIYSDLLLTFFYPTFWYLAHVWRVHGKYHSSFFFNLSNTDSCIRYCLKLCLSVSNESVSISIQELNDEGQVINFEAIRDWISRDILARNYLVNNEVSGPKRDHSFISNSTCFTSPRSQDWFADSGATQHMTDQRKFFKCFSLVEENTWFVKGIGGAQLAVHGYGSIEFTALVDGTKWTALIETVLYVSDLGVNLLSIAAITEIGVTVHFIESHVIFNKNDSIVMVGERIGRTLYHLAITVDPPCDWACFTTPAPPSIDVRHQPSGTHQCQEDTQDGISGNCRWSDSTQS